MTNYKSKNVFTNNLKHFHQCYNGIMIIKTHYFKTILFGIIPIIFNLIDEV